MVSISPINIDLTNHSLIATLKKNSRVLNIP